MKTKNQFFVKLTILLCLISTYSFSQNDDELYISVTTMYWNFNHEDFSMDNWKAIEKEYHEKVIMQNEHIVSTNVLVHHFTENSSELLFVSVYPSWQSIEDGTKRNQELEETAWPDKAQREDFLNRQSRLYSNEHSDEIYYSIPGAIQLEDPESPHIFYVRTRHRAFPEEGNDKEFEGLLSEYNNVVTNQNEFYKAYYPQMHHYGSDRSEFIEVFVVETLADLERGIAEQTKLFNAHWTDEDKKEAFNDKFNKYFTGIHGDRIFSSVPELYKGPPGTSND